MTADEEEFEGEPKKNAKPLRLSLKDAIALLIALLGSAFLPVVILSIILLSTAILLMIFL